MKVYGQIRSKNRRRYERRIYLIIFTLVLQYIKVYTRFEHGKAAQSKDTGSLSLGKREREGRPGGCHHSVVHSYAHHQRSTKKGTNSSSLLPPRTNQMPQERSNPSQMHPSHRVLGSFQSVQVPRVPASCQPPAVGGVEEPCEASYAEPQPQRCWSRSVDCQIMSHTLCEAPWGKMSCCVTAEQDHSRHSLLHANIVPEDATDELSEERVVCDRVKAVDRDGKS